MATDPVVCIPWRPQPERLQAFQYVRRMWSNLGFRVIPRDSLSERFNVAEARNRAVRDAVLLYRAEAVIVADADTVVTERGLRNALRQVRDGYVIYPFTEYRLLNAEPAADLELETAPVTAYHWNSCGGMFVTTPETYWAVGGQDERFSQWGYEDNAFQAAAETLATVARVPGTAYAFNHAGERDLSDDNPGKHRMRLYNFARGHEAVMRELIR